MKESPNERLARLISESGLNQSEFADFVDVGYSTIKNYAGNKSKLKINPGLVRKLLAVIPLNAEWLMEGEGDMLTDPTFTFSVKKVRRSSRKQLYETTYERSKKVKRIQPEVLHESDLRLIQRIIKERERLNYTQKDWANQLDIPLSFQEGMENDELRLTAEYFEKMYKLSEIDIHFVFTGKRILPQSLASKKLSAILEDYARTKQQLVKQEEIISEFVSRISKLNLINNDS